MTARIVRDTAGRHQLELAGLDTSDGRDLRVPLSDQQVRTGGLSRGGETGPIRCRLGKLEEL